MMNITKVKAVLKQTVSYIKEGEQIQHKSGTEIEVDPEHGIAFHEGDHFDIDTTEYKVVYLN